jgi:hypothetical protein
MATLLNRTINTVTGSNLPYAARFEPANRDQQQGMEAAEMVMLVSPIAEVAVAASHCTTALLETDKGAFAGGGVRDLTAAPGEHAEVTVMNAAIKGGARPTVIETSRPMCAECRSFLKAAGATLESATRAVWK